jgi:hypothetical protein
VEKAMAMGVPTRGKLSSRRPVHSSGAAVNVVENAADVVDMLCMCVENIFIGWDARSMTLTVHTLINKQSTKGVRF